MILRIQGLGKRLGDRRVFHDVSLEVGDGEVVALVGPNGAGKSTFLRVAAGVLRATLGEVTLDDGASVLRGRAVREHVGFVPEGADPLPHLAVAELLDLTASLRRAPPLEPALLARLGLAELGTQRLGTLSLGQRRRACLAAALVGDPWLLLLDEPTNGLSPDGVELLAVLLAERRARSKATVVATHDLSFATALGARVVPFAGEAA